MRAATYRCPGVNVGFMQVTNRLTKEIIPKIRRRARNRIIRLSYGKRFYPLLYRSWWHALLKSTRNTATGLNYLCAVPHRGAGIGHQMANWIAGLWFAREFSLAHAHVPFSNEKWDRFLGLGENSPAAKNLIQQHGYVKVLLPLFDEFNPAEVDRIRKIIASYGGKKVVFHLEQDQFYRDQFGVIDEMQKRFYHSSARMADQVKYASEHFNIAIHVRRGDIVAGQANRNQNLLMRWQDTQYFKNVLSAVLRTLKTDKQIKVYLFSQGTHEEFSDFEEFGNVEYCLETEERESFLHMIYADLLITSKSSFSYKPALLSKGIKVCPRNFWHGYPENEKWILAEEDGSLDARAARKLNGL